MALDKYQVSSICFYTLESNLYSSKISSKHVNVAFPQVWLLTSSVLSTTSKHCFEQPAASFLVCSLIFIEYYFAFLFKEKWSGTGSLPVFDQGWQRKIRAKPIKTPLKPCFSIASIMQLEQVGSKRQEGGKAGEIKPW